MKNKAIRVITSPLERRIKYEGIERVDYTQQNHSYKKMTKKISVSGVGLVSIGILLGLIFVVSATPSKAHAQLVLDPSTTSLLTSTISATGNLVSTVQSDINAGAFNQSQSLALSGTLGGIAGVLSNISSIISGVGFPNTGFPPGLGK